MCYLITLGSMFVLIYTITPTCADPSNCYQGAACDKCAEGYYNFVGKLKVCCPDCSKYFRSGYTPIDGISYPYCNCDDEYLIGGDCWKGTQCEKCLAGPNRSAVGYINSVPICCENCENSGLEIHLGRDFCNCLHNGP